MEYAIFDGLWEAENENRTELEEHPFLDYLWAVKPEFGIGRIDPIERSAQKVKSGLIIGITEASFSLRGELLLERIEELGVTRMEFRNDLVATRLEEEEHEALELLVSRLGGVEVGENSVTSGEFSGRHESAGEHIFLLDLGDVEENREAFSVEQGDDLWVGSYEWSGRHVGAENC